MRPLLLALLVGFASYALPAYVFQAPAPASSSAAPPSAPSATARAATARLVTDPAPGAARAPLTTQLQTVWNSKNALVNAAQAQAMIDQMSVADFRKLVDDPSFLPQTYGAADQDFRDLFYEALVERWLALAPE